jgi:hypothetical protein
MALDVSPPIEPLLEADSAPQGKDAGGPDQQTTWLQQDTPPPQGTFQGGCDQQTTWLQEDTPPPQGHRSGGAEQQTTWLDQDTPPKQGTFQGGCDQQTQWSFIPGVIQGPAFVHTTLGVPSTIQGPAFVHVSQATPNPVQGPALVHATEATVTQTAPLKQAEDAYREMNEGSDPAIISTLVGTLPNRSMWADAKAETVQIGGGTRDAVGAGTTVSLLGGNAQAASGSNGGSVTVRGGAADGAGADGVLNLGTASTSVVNIAASGVNTSVASTLDVDSTLTLGGGGASTALINANTGANLVVQALDTGRTAAIRAHGNVFLSPNNAAAGSQWQAAAASFGPSSTDNALDLGSASNRTRTVYAGTSMIVGGGTQTLTVSGTTISGAPDSGSTPINVFFVGGQQTGSGAGGSSFLAGGNGSGNGNIGGTANVLGGSGNAPGAVTTNGGLVVIDGGIGNIDNTGASGVGGAVFVRGGTVGPTTAGGTGGAVLVEGGGGGGSAGTTVGGAATLRSGPGTNGGASGTVTVDAGAAPGGTAGVVSVGAANASAINIGRSGITTDFVTGQTVDFTGCTVTGLTSGVGEVERIAVANVPANTLTATNDCLEWEARSSPRSPTWRRTALPD